MITNRIRLARAARHLSQAELAARAGIGATVLHRIEVGHRAATTDEREQLCDVLNFLEDVLFPEIASGQADSEYLAIM
jgi:ribosome-binding protein aMBF1 (putative translation factor)